MKEYFKDAIVYYYRFLVKEGYKDPVRVLISDFLETVKVTDEQEKYMKKEAGVNSKDIDNLLILIKKMKADKEIDIQSLDLIENYLKKM